MRKTPKYKRMYYNKGVNRRKQIYHWFNEVVIEYGLGFYFKEINLFVANGEMKKALDRFSELISEIVALYHTQGVILGYLINENIEEFGKNVIILDLFNNIVKPTKIQKKKLPKRIKPETTEEKREATEKARDTPTYRKGIDKKGHYQKAEILIFTSRGKTQVRLRNPETKRFLKMTKTTQKELEDRGIIKE